MHALAQWSVHSKAGAHIDILKSGIKQTYVFEAVVRVEKKMFTLSYHQSKGYLPYNLNFM